LTRTGEGPSGYQGEETGKDQDKNKATIVLQSKKAPEEI
jgi:hypothetical protein